MAKGENGAPARRHEEPTSDTDEGGSKRSSERSKHRSRSKSRSDGKKRRSSSRKSRDDEREDSDNSCSSKSDSQSESGSYSDSQSGSSDEYSESEDERRRRKRKERKKREEEKKERRRKERKRRRKDREEEEEEEKKKKRKKKKKKDNDSKGKKSAVTNSWGKYGIIRETDMWNKRPEFTAWLGEVKKVNLESLPNWEEKQMFKDFMEDHNTATFPSKKYYNLDAYYRRQMEKEMKKGTKKVRQAERTVFDDEEQRRLELRREREKQKEQEVEALKVSMQGGMAQAMKDQALLREEMAYQFKIGNHEAAAAIQRRLDPDVAM